MENAKPRSPRGNIEDFVAQKAKSAERCSRIAAYLIRIRLIELDSNLEILHGIQVDQQKFNRLDGAGELARDSHLTSISPARCQRNEGPQRISHAEQLCRLAELEHRDDHLEDRHEYD